MAKQKAASEKSESSALTIARLDAAEAAGFASRLEKKKSFLTHLRIERETQTIVTKFASEPFLQFDINYGVKSAVGDCRF